MEKRKWRHLVAVLLIALGGLCVIGACETGEQAVDEITGNRAVKQYHKARKDIEKIADRQAERYRQIPDEERDDRRK